MLAQAGSDGMTIQNAVEKLGLKLEPKEIKVPAIVVDNVAAEFTPNPPDLARRIPPLPSPEFEVATVKPSPPDVTQPRAQLLPSGQVTATGVPLNLMISLAWDLPNEQLRRRAEVAGVDTLRVDRARLCDDQPERQRAAG